MTRDEVLAKIEAVEAKQHRAIREGLLAQSKDENALAHARLVAIEAEIKVLRAQLDPAP